MAAIGITIASVLVFILAAALFPGDPGRFYSLGAVVLVGLTLVLRAFSLPTK